MKSHTKQIIHSEMRYSAVKGKFRLLQTSAKQQMNLAKHEILIHVKHDGGKVVVAKFIPNGPYDVDKEYADALAEYVKKHFKGKAKATKIIFTKPKLRVFKLQPKKDKKPDPGTQAEYPRGQTPVIQHVDDSPFYQDGEKQYIDEPTDEEMVEDSK